MAPYRNSPPPDWAGWSDDSLYYPRSDPLSGGDDPGEDYGELTAPELSAPPRSTTPFGQFLPSLLDAVARRPQPVPPGQFLASIGVHLPPPQSVLGTRRYDPPPPPLVPLEGAADYTTLSAPQQMVGSQSAERVAGFGATPARLPAELQGDGVLMNAAAGLAQGVYGTLGAPVDAMTWALNGGISLANFAGADLPRIEDPFLGSRSLARGGTYLGIPDPESVAAVTPAEGIARGVGEGAAYMVAPSAMARGGAALAARELPWLAQAVFGRASSAREFGREAAIGGAAGGTGKAAHELAPEAWKPTAAMVGGLLGGVTAARATAAPGIAGRLDRPFGSVAASPARVATGEIPRPAPEARELRSLPRSNAVTEGLESNYSSAVTVNRISKGEGAVRPELGARLLYMGRNPHKFSPTGAKVIERMRNEGNIVGEGPLLRGNPHNLQLRLPNQSLVEIDSTIDMAHLNDAVTWWNQIGRYTWPRSPTVRQFMLDSDNYILQPRSVNRAAGPRLRQRYLPPFKSDSIQL
jgi:hypothetical protein